MTEQISNPESLEMRIARLERQNQRIKWVVVFITTVAIVGIMMSYQDYRTQSQTKGSNLTAKRIQAESFDLVVDGKVKAQLKYDASQTSLTFNDEEGYKRLAVGTTFGVPFSGPYLEMFSGAEQTGSNSHMTHEKNHNSLKSRH